MRNVLHGPGYAEFAVLIVYVVAAIQAVDAQRLWIVECDDTLRRARESEGKLAAVADTGVGIPADVIPRIFEPFFTTKLIGKGTGLGLATVIGCVRDHRGAVEVESELGKGSRFCLYLPISAQGRSLRAGIPRVASFNAGGKLALVVDDEPIVRNSMARLLKHFGFSVQTAEDGDRTLILLKELPSLPVVALLDLQLHGMNGRDLASQLRERYPALPIVLKTYSMCWRSSECSNHQRAGNTNSIAGGAPGRLSRAKAATGGQPCRSSGDLRRSLAATTLRDSFTSLASLHHVLENHRMHQRYPLLAVLTVLGWTGANTTACSSTDDGAAASPQGLGGNAATTGGGTSAPPSSSVSVGGTTANVANAGGASSSGGYATTVAAANGGTTSSGGTRTIDSTSTGGAKAAGGATGSSSIGGNAAGGATSTSSAYACNLVFGNSTTQQWFDGGFLTYPQVESSRWELIAAAHHYIDSWANANDVGWTSAFDLGHQCANHATTPDRVIFIVTYSPPYPAQATYQTYITSIVNNIRTQYPTVKRIELTTLVRAPGNSATACSAKANNEQAMPAAEDQAIAAVAAAPAFAGLVVALPPFYVTSCSDFITDAPQYTTTGATNIAKVYGAYYAEHP